MKTWFALPLLCLACFCAGTLCCPKLCQCYHRSAEVVCNAAPLTEYPAEGLPTNTSMMTIQFTNLSSITEQQLSFTPHLRGLHLFSNRLRQLSPHLLRGVPFLRTLDLTENRLSALPAEVFSHASLTSLVLENNQLEEADGSWLPENSTLTWLDLSGNRLTTLRASLLRKTPSLVNLDLSDNRLERIEAKSLEPLTRLERLNLQGNMLTSLDGDLFQNTSRVGYLFLSRNQLGSLPRDLFRELTELKALSLDENQLSHIPAGLLEPLGNLDADGLDLAANPWVCDGKMEYLWRWIQKNKEKVSLPERVVCAKPPSLAGRSVISLTENELKL